MSPKLSSNDLKGASEALLDFLMEQSEKRLVAQAQLMAAADSRANALLGASVALSAAAVATAVGQSDADGNARLVYGAAAFALFSVAAAGLAVSALWPTSIHVVGWTGQSFVKDIRARKTDRVMKAEIVSLLHRRVEGNRDCSSRLTKRVKAAMLCLTLAPAVGLAVGIYSPTGPAGLISGLIASVALGFATYFVEKLRAESSAPPSE